MIDTPMFFLTKADPKTQAAIASIFTRLRILFEEMDRKYEAVAERYGFRCDGCSENCCETRFYHHTWIEYAYLEGGMKTLSPALRTAIQERAARVVAQTREAVTVGGTVRLMCPLNQQQRCLLYSFRPMICRLHGISHELHQQNGRMLKGEGCRQFDGCAGGKPYIRFDRTPFYREMALLEKQARIITGISGKIKMTVAEMIVSQNCLDPEVPDS